MVQDVAGSSPAGHPKEGYRRLCTIPLDKPPVSSIVATPWAATGPMEVVVMGPLSSLWLVFGMICVFMSLVAAYYVGDVWQSRYLSLHERLPFFMGFVLLVLLSTTVGGLCFVLFFSSLGVR